MKSKKPTGNFSHKFYKMSAAQKQALLAKLNAAKAKAQDNNDTETEALIDDAIQMAIVIPPDEDPGNVEPPKP